MAKYRVTFMEKIYYSVVVEADDEEEAEEMAIDAFDSGDHSVECTNSYVNNFDVCEEEK